MQHENIRVLFVDDSTLLRNMVSACLGRLGVKKILTASQGLEGLQVMNDNHDINFVVVDWEMPVMSGMEFLKEVRANAAFHDVYITMMTSNSGERYVLEAFSAGANDYLVKPFREEDFVKKFERMCQSRQRLETLRFGEFLTRRKEVTAEQLDIALESQMHLDFTKTPVGCLVLCREMTDADRVLRDVVGRLAEDGLKPDAVRGILTSGDFWTSMVGKEKMEELSALMGRSALPVGEILVKLGFLKENRLGTCLEQFKSLKG